MEKVAEFLRRERWWPVWILIGGALLLLPRLGSPGFWEPQEIKVADDARTRLEAHSLTEITRAVTGHYKVPEADMKKAERTDKETEARNVSIYLADKHTKETYSDLRRAFAVDKHEVVESVVQLMRERVGNQAETELRNSIAEIEKKLAEADAKQQSRAGPDLTEEAVAFGLDTISWDEWGARLPLALLGLLGLMATFFLGARLGGPRAGLLAALVLLSTPLFVMQSRQLTSDIGAVSGSAMMMLGLVGLSWPAGDRTEIPIWMLVVRYAGDAVLIAVGSLITYHAAGALLGLIPPLAAVALANPIAIVADRRRREPAPGDHPDAVPAGDRTWRAVHLLAVGMVAGVVAVVVLAWLIGQVFEFTDPVPGGRQLFGKSWTPVTEPVAALGGAWKPNGDLNQTYSSLFEQLAFGLFPWSALAPLAVGYLALGRRRGRRSWAGYAILLWVAAGWAFATIMTRKVGPVHMPAIAGIAVALGMWLDDVLSARADAADDGDVEETERRYGIGPRLPLAGFFAAAAAVTLAKDIKAFPDYLASIHVLGSTVTYPKEMSLTSFVLVYALLFAAVAFLALWLWERWSATGGGLLQQVRRWAGRFGIHALVGLGVIFGLFMAQVWMPELSRKLSSKHLFARYQELKSPGDRLGVMGNHGNGPKYYAGDSFTRLGNRNDLLDFLRDERRGFALVPAGELCPVHRASAKTELDYYVLDDSHAKFLLMSNKLEQGESDLNPLSTAIVRERPASIGRQVSANYDNRIELIGVDMPSRVDRGDRFKMTLYYKVNRAISGNWKVFVHFDTAGIRFQGDHDPINGRCGTAYWQPGDYIVDSFWVEAGDISYPKGNYVAKVGFFQGAHGNWKNMKVVSGNADDADRVAVGNIQVQ